MCWGARLEAGGEAGEGHVGAGLRFDRCVRGDRERERDCQTGSENRPGVLQGDLTMKHVFAITVVPA